MVTATANVYATADGKPTLDSHDGKNELLIVAGSNVEDEAAQKLGLDSLFASFHEDKVKVAQAKSDPVARAAAMAKAHAKPLVKPATEGGK